MELFVNPWYMVAGGAMVSSPIIIHLINRMRFKRIRWAAMEFLLKAQKKNRRRLIIEQLILLMLRCLLVLLAAFLVSRFVGHALGLTQGGNTTHVVILDDTASMQERVKQGEDCFSIAKKQVLAVARKAADANNPQFLKLILLSDPQNRVFDERLNDESLKKLASTLDQLQPTPAHVDLVEGVKVAEKLLADINDPRKWIHLASDFRERDWSEGSGAEALRLALDKVRNSKINVTMLDSASPARQSNEPQPAFGDNFAITDLRPEKRVVPASTGVKFALKIKNLGQVTREKIKLDVFVDGSPEFRVIPYIEAPSRGEEKEYFFELEFGPPGEKERAKFHRVTAKIGDIEAEDALLLDNVRHAIIEVRKEVPTLVIDGSGDDGKKPGGDTRSVTDVLTSAPGNERAAVVSGTIKELERPDLIQEYATIYLLNVRDLITEDKAPPAGGAGQPPMGVQPTRPETPRPDPKKSKKGRALENLQEFVRAGGNVVFFLGDRVDQQYYNDVLFRDCEGLFPVPLEGLKENFELRAGGAAKARDEKFARLKANRQPKIYAMDRDHEILQGLYLFQNQLHELYILEYFRTRDREQWKGSFGKPDDIKELITLASDRKLDDGVRSTMQRRYLDRLNRAVNDKKWEKFVTRVKKEAGKPDQQVDGPLKIHLKRVTEAVFGKEDELHKLAQAIEAMLTDRGNPSAPDNVDLTEFWNSPEWIDMKNELETYRKDLLYGDTLSVMRKYGKGNVVAVLTTAGSKWNGWAGGPLSGGHIVNISYTIFLVDLQKFLTRGGDTGGRNVGDEVQVELDEKRYKGEYQFFVQKDETAIKQDGAKPDDKQPAVPGFVPLSSEPQKIKAEDGKFLIKYRGKKPGIHFVKLFPLAADQPVEERWFAYNLDTINESNLRRASQPQLLGRAVDDSKGSDKGATFLFKPGDDLNIFRERQQDLSETPWIFLLLLFILVIEQALAVHLSFHVKGAEEVTAPTVALASARPQAA